MRKQSNRPVCPECDAKTDLVRYSRGDPEALREGRKGERPKLEYECIHEECTGRVVLRAHLSSLETVMA